MSQLTLAAKEIYGVLRRCLLHVISPHLHLLPFHSLLLSPQQFLHHLCNKGIVMVFFNLPTLVAFSSIEVCRPFSENLNCINNRILTAKHLMVQFCNELELGQKVCFMLCKLSKIQHATLTIGLRRPSVSIGTTLSCSNRT